MAPSVYKVCKSRTRGENVEKMRLLLFEVRTPLHYTKFMGGRTFLWNIGCALSSGITYILSDALSLRTQRSGTKFARRLWHLAH